MKTLKLRLAIVLISLLSLLVSPAAISFPTQLDTATKNDPPPPTGVLLSDDPSTEDEGWAIIKNETVKRKNLSTGQETILTITVKQEPPTKDKIVCKEKHQTKTDKAVVAATCIVNRYSVVSYAEVPGAGGGVRGYAKNIANEYCNGGNCGFYKMTKLQIWWTRISTSWGVRSTRTTWGCNGACTLCSGGTTGYIYQSGYFNPTWNGLTSTTYTYTDSSMPIMRSMSEYGIVTGGNDSLVVLPNNQTSPLSVYASYP